MSEIKKELWKLSEKMEIEGKSSTIAGQINIMNRALDGQPGRDIADSVKKYADVASSGGGDIKSQALVYGNYVYGPNPSAQGTLDKRSSVLIIVIPIDGVAECVGRYDSGVPQSDAYTSVIFVMGEVTKVNLDYYIYNNCVTFKAAENFDGLYSRGNKVIPTGDTIEPGKWYNALYYNNTITVEANDALGMRDLYNP